MAAISDCVGGAEQPLTQTSGSWLPSLIEKFSKTPLISAAKLKPHSMAGGSGAPVPATGPRLLNRSNRARKNHRFPLQTTGALIMPSLATPAAPADPFAIGVLGRLEFGIPPAQP